MSARARARGVLAFLYTLALPAVLSFAASSRRRLFVAFSSAIALTTCGKSFLNACGFARDDDGRAERLGIVVVVVLVVVVVVVVVVVFVVVVVESLPSGAT